MYEVAVEKMFSAAHALRDYHGACEPIHGHNYRVRVLLEGEELDATGMLVDFLEVEAIVKDTILKYDHLFLNETPPFDRVNPSAENMARLFHEAVSERIAAGQRTNEVRVREVSVWETDEMRATYRA